MSKQASTIAVPLPETIEAEYAELRKLETDRLRALLIDSLHVSAATLRRLALIVRVLEERGEDLADLRIGLLPYLRQIAHGQVLPEVIVRFAESPWMIRLVGSLPLPDQKRLADGDRVTLIVPREGTYEKRLSDPGSMTRDQVLQVFGRDRLRTEEEQILLLESKAQRKPRTEHKGKIRPDHKTGTLRVGKAVLTVPEVLEAIQDLRGAALDDGEEERTKTLAIQMSEAEHRDLKQHSSRTGVSMADLVRRAMRSAGLI